MEKENKNQRNWEVIAECKSTRNFLRFMYERTYTLKETVKQETNLDIEVNIEVDPEQLKRSIRRKLWMKGWNPNSCTIDVHELD